MTDRASARRNAAQLLLPALACCVALCGCRGSVGEQLALRPQPAPLAPYVGRALELPRDAPYSITLAPTQEAPGLDGKADAEAQVRPDGSGRVSARVENGGSASGTIQLGHSFGNDTERQVDLSVTVALEYEYEATSGQVSRSPEANLTLTLFARDERNRELATVEVLRHSTDHGAASGTGARDVRLAVTLGPGQSASVYLAAAVQVSAEYGRTAGGSIALKNTRMRVEVQPAPAPGSAADGSR